jgi:signal transduction histidine kinase/ActR/RegA family two-component response regulator
MFFLDAAGFFSLVTLMAQCGLAWAIVLLFVVLGARLERTAWLRSWVLAYIALATALSAVLARFLLVSHADWTPRLAEGALLTKVLYAAYAAGKLLFLWFLLAGTFALRHRRSPRLRWSLAPILAAAALAGACLPTIEWHLLLQAPLFVGTNLAAWWLLRSHGRERQDAGSRVVAAALLLWSLLWLVYAFAVLVAGPSHPVLESAASYVLRWNSLADLLVQSGLAFGLLTLVLQDAQFTLAATAAERDRLRSVVQRDEKLRALSTLVSGVAHELNNPLTAILGFAPDLDGPDAGTRAVAAQVVREQAERCRGIVRRLSTVAGSDAVVRRSIAVQPLLERVARGFQPALEPRRLRLQLDVPADLPDLELDATAIEQVVANLVGNAIHASPNGGVIRVAAGIDDGTARLVVEDDGPGVPLAIRAQLFEPFFTTKPTGQGSGLGLAVAHSLVRAHGGTIVVEDRVPHGARFVVTVPLAPPAEPPMRGHEPAAVGSGRGRSVLVVDDEPLVRTTIARHFERRGWSVEHAASGAEALRVLDERGDHFAAVLCDLRMPGMSGSEVHAEVARVRPEVGARFVFATGDPLAAAEQESAAGRRVPVVAKPFEFGEVFAAVERVAAARSA